MLFGARHPDDYPAAHHLAAKTDAQVVLPTELLNDSSFQIHGNFKKVLLK